MRYTLHLVATLANFLHSTNSGCPQPSLLQTCMRLLRSLFYNLALGKFLDVQAAFGASGLHSKLVDASLGLLRGPSATAALVRALQYASRPCTDALGGCPQPARCPLLR